MNIQRLINALCRPSLADYERLGTELATMRAANAELQASLTASTKRQAKLAYSVAEAAAWLSVAGRARMDPSTRAMIRDIRANLISALGPAEDLQQATEVQP